MDTSRIYFHSWLACYSHLRNKENKMTRHRYNELHNQFNTAARYAPADFFVRGILNAFLLY
jgi:hypothetical protein